MASAPQNNSSEPRGEDVDPEPDHDASKPTSLHVESKDEAHEAQEYTQMRTAADDLSVFQAVRRYRLVCSIGMAAAFSSSLDGYQITLNGGIISNEGFIRQFSPSGAEILDGQWVSAWGGMQSVGQFVGQVCIQYITERFGRKLALYVMWLMLFANTLAESLATSWEHWLAAKLFAGLGVGMLQATLPVYLGEVSPTQLRGFLINAYSFWFVVGQLFGAVALEQMSMNRPLAFRPIILTQWAMMGLMLIILILLPESPWWLVSQGRVEKAAKVLNMFYGHVDGYNVHEQLNAMQNTVEHERHTAQRDNQEGYWAVFQGRNLLRFFIASWPKVTQQFVGLTV